MEQEPGRLVLTPTDIRQFVYCPRVVFYHFILGRRPTTEKMAYGKEVHAQLAELEVRRSLRAYSLREGERHFDVPLSSPRLGLSGRLDMAIRTPFELIPVEFKATQAGLGLHHKYQLVAYALLLEECWAHPVGRAFAYLVQSRRVVELRITPHARQQVHTLLAQIRAILRQERLPEGTPHLGRCRACEFLRYCNDRW